MPHKFKAAILGSSAVAESHLRYLSGSKVVKPFMIFGRHRERVSFLSKKYDLISAISVDECLKSSDVALVDISTSNELHFEYALSSLCAGKNVILEKPAAFSADDVKKLVMEAQQKNVEILTCFQKRFNRSFKKVQSLIKQGMLGNFLYGDTRVFMPRKTGYYRSDRRSKIALSGGGVLIYQAIHDLDLLCLLFGPVKSVQGKLWNRNHSVEVEDTAQLILEFESGGIHNFFSTTDQRFPSQTETRLVFENGWINFNDFGCNWSKKKEPAIPKLKFFYNNSLGRRYFYHAELGSYRNILKEMEEFLLHKKNHVTSDLSTAVIVYEVIQTFYDQTRK